MDRVECSIYLMAYCPKLRTHTGFIKKIHRGEKSYELCEGETNHFCEFYGVKINTLTDFGNPVRHSLCFDAYNQTYDSVASERKPFGRDNILKALDGMKNIKLNFKVETT
jgi:hypothetical protein